MWQTALRWLLPFLAELLIAFVRNLRAARADDPSLLAVIEEIVRGVERDNPNATGEDKRAWALKAIGVRLRELGIDAKDSLVNAVLELTVQKLKAAA